MYLVNTPAPVAQCHADEKVDLQEADASEVSEVSAVSAVIEEAEVVEVKAEVAAVEETELLGMVGQRRHRRSWMLRWKIIGVLKKVALIVQPQLRPQLRLRLGKMILR